MVWWEENNKFETSREKEGVIENERGGEGDGGGRKGKRENL
jgi:hypothetical protein